MGIVSSDRQSFMEVWVSLVECGALRGQKELIIEGDMLPQSDSPAPDLPLVSSREPPAHVIGNTLSQT